MLVNVITRYPPPPPANLVATVLANLQQFGSPLVLDAGRRLQPTAVANQQAFGLASVGRPAQQLIADRLINVAVFGTASIAPIVHGTHYLLPVALPAANQFGSPTVARAPKFVLPETVHNSNQFGNAQIGSAPKRFSYSNAQGIGDRTGSITVTTSGGSVFDSPMRLVNGNTSENVFWGFGSVTIKFDLGASKIIRQARWIQSTSTTHSGFFQWQGSNDDAAYVDIGGTFNLGGSQVSLCNTLLANDVAYRYYRLSPTEGASLSGTPYFREVEFYIEGSADDPPD